MSPSSEHAASNAKLPSLYSLKSIRFRIVFLMMFAMFCSCSIRSHLGVTIVCMINATALERQSSSMSLNRSTEDDCPLSKGHQSLADFGYNGDLLWTSSDQGFIFSAMSFGSLITLLPSGMLADRFGPKLIIFWSVLVMAVMSYIAPLLANLHVLAFTASRFIVGACNGCIMPSLTALGARWFAKDERSTMNAMYTSGVQLAGIAIGLATPLLCTSNILSGWPFVYYVYASVAVAFATLWMPFVSNHVENNRHISDVERQYVTENTVVRKNQEKKTFPWMKAFLSPPFWAILVVRTAFVTQDKIMTAYTATYIRDVLRTDLQTNGIYTSLPYIAQLISKNVVSAVADYLKRKKFMSHTVSVRVFQLISNAGTALCFIILALYADCNHTVLGVAFLTLRNLFLAFVSPGMHTSGLSIAPAYSGSVLSITMFIASVVATVALYVVGVALESVEHEIGMEYYLHISCCRKRLDRNILCNFCINRCSRMG
ncbi:hypothetical protein QR680_015870 [Steinernema hermaphroditum]|uniref:Major facilitator superfamily (MFS) profile domain-containing protein n=1 Tax=Steinernema hermaphroditum TaxID=289476 RepID=A0AA39H9I4_9BILA|nr:hypothetical protein QR680_015870 [Steinernema hermaphroditum]